MYAIIFIIFITYEKHSLSALREELYAQCERRKIQEMDDLYDQGKYNFRSIYYDIEREYDEKVRDEYEYFENTNIIR